MLELRKGDVYITYDHTWVVVVDHVDPRTGVTLRPHYRSTSGNIVRVLPPEYERGPWEVSACDEDGSLSPKTSDFLQLTGEDVERRAFSIAEGYRTQQRA